MVTHFDFSFFLSLCAVIIAVFTLDDLFIDIYALFKKIKLTEINHADLEAPIEKTIAIMIANWHEENILEQMITGNNKTIEYSRHHFFLGVYPNDLPTYSVAKKLEEKFKNVTCVVNQEPGPTSKGQMMNQIVDQIFKFETTSGINFDLFVIHDSEDIIHPFAMKLFNKSSMAYDYMQIPIFSLNRDIWQLTAGTYMDEFAEMHAKELLIRNAMGAAIPSAGVGTCMSRELMLAIQNYNKGYFLRPDSLTEDYILGWQSHLNHFRCGFICQSIVGDKDKKNIIATHEYFPQKFTQSIKQKTRWTIGIAFQAKKIIGWTSRSVDNYFLFRSACLYLAYLHLE
jgi:bacteriophage N4 adsorption protein B